MEYKECHYYTTNPMHFHGCPGLDVNGDSDECGECQYRLDNVCKALAVINHKPTQSGHPGNRV